MPEARPLPDLVVETQPAAGSGRASVFSALDLDLGLVDAADLQGNPPPAAFLVSEAPAAAPVASGSETPLEPYAQTEPCMLPTGTQWAQLRALVVHDDASERMHWRARMALARLVWVDEASTSTQAIKALEARRYSLLVVTCQAATIDPADVVNAFHHFNPKGMAVLTGVLPPEASADGFEPAQPDRWSDRLKAKLLGHADLPPFLHSASLVQDEFAFRLPSPLSPLAMETVLRAWERQFRG